jgi:hypothetical protein
VSDFKELKKESSSRIPTVRDEILRKKILNIKKEVGPRAKKRALKRWKQSYGYYYLHPEKFKFGLRNLK